MIEGMARFDRGDIRRALVDLTTVEQDAKKYDVGLQFAATAVLFNRLSEFEHPEASLPLLGRLRQIAAANGDSASLSSLHLAVAKLDACRGNCFEARRHLEISRGFARRTQSTQTRCAIDLVDASLEILAGNIQRAVTSARSSYELAVLSDSKIQMAGAAGILGLLALLIGNPRQGREYLTQALDLAHEVSYMRLGILDNLAQVELYEDNLLQCSSYLDQCSREIQQQLVPARSWYDFAHQVTRCAVLAQLEKWTDIVQIADEAEAELDRRQFRSLRTALLCARARALSRLEKTAQAENSLAEAVRICPRGAADSQILLEWSTGSCLTVTGDRAKGLSLFDRALAATRAIGNRFLEWQIERDRATATLRGPSRNLLGVSQIHQEHQEHAVSLSDAATIIGSGSSIDLLAHRAEALLNNTTLRERLTIRSTSGEEFLPDRSVSWAAHADGRFVIELRGSDRRVTLSVLRADSLEDVALLKSLVELLEASISRADSENGVDSASLWPTSLLPGDDSIVVRSPRMAEVLRVALRLAATNLPILITGETGTGKDVIARLIHSNSPAKKGSFIPFNCSAIPKDLVESQLFGHRRGAFTGAIDSSLGVIRSAEGGTLFLDEIGELDLALQPKLLRFLESGEIHTVGESRPHKTSVRVVAATNADLETLAVSGGFRRDLFFRLGAARITIPPLRDRKDEIPALTAVFVAKFSRECQRPSLRVSDEFIAALLMHDWPGNIRQLINELHRVVAMAEPGQTLTSADLSDDVTRSWKEAAHTSGVSNGPGLRVNLDQPLPGAIEEVERIFIERAMKASGGRVNEAAELLGISRKGLFLKRRRWGLSGDDPEA
jgi:DNA-binding NtrC family response regulator/tetratricopeptide (TPR) repeat protein